MKIYLSQRGLLRNTGALYQVQIANYLVPLILLPFLTRVLGAAGYGQLATLQAIITYGLVLTDYGFQLSATRKVAAMLERGERVYVLYAQVTVARVVLALLATLSMSLVIAALPYLSLTLELGSALLILVLSNALTPLWLFQGFQRMGLVGVVVLTSRVMAAVFTLLLVRSSQDVALALWAQAFGSALPAAFALWEAARLVPSVGRPSLAGVWNELVEGWPVFQTAVFSTLLTNSGILILGSTSGAQVAGGYAAVERVGKGVASLLAPVTQAIYPRVSACFARSHQEGLRVMQRFGLPLLVLSGAMAGLIVIIGLLRGIGWLFGPDYQRFEGALFVLAPWMVLGVLNNLLGIQYLTNIGQQGWYAGAFTVSSLVALALFFVLSRWWSYWGIAWGLVFGEALLAVLLSWRVYRVGRAWREEGG